MKFIINTSNLKSGGAIQVALSVLQELELKQLSDEFYVLLSPQIEKQIDQNKFGKNFNFISIKNNPTKSILTALFFHSKLQKIEKKINADAVLSIFGPALWKPNKPHLVGFANGYYLFDDSEFIKEKVLSSSVKRLKYCARSYLLFKQLKKEANYYWVETEMAKQKLLKKLNLNSNRITVISNTYNSNFEKEIVAKRDNNDTFELLYVSAYYEHKNFEILPLVIEQLKLKIENFCFIVTLSDEQYGRLFEEEKYSKHLRNIGEVAQENLPKIYSEADAVFMPSMLEIFSANYPEAMKANKLLLCSDYDFSRAICGDAALYFDAKNPKDIADKINKLISNKPLQERLIDNGQKQLLHFETAKSRTEKLLAILKSIAQQ